MAIAFPAYHDQTFELPMAVTHDWIEYACRAAGFARPLWGVGAQGGAWRLSTNTSFFSWGENIAIYYVGPTMIRIRSECALVTQCIDWGRNESNVRKIVNALLWAMRNPAQIYR
jgi:hypothetical protein